MSIPGRQSINIGLPNEPTNSDTIRDAFIKVENNFINLFSQSSSFTSFVGGNGIEAQANLLTSTLTITNTGVTSLAAGNNIALSQSNGNVTISVVGIPEALSAITVTGNDQPNITSVGTLVELDVAGNLVVIGGVLAGDGSGLTNINAANIIGGIPTSQFATVAETVSANDQPNITSVGTLTGLTVDGTITGNGSIDLAMLGTGNANSSTYLRGDGTWSENTVTLTSAPTSNVDPGITGQIAADSGGNVYICIAPNTWTKVTGTTSW